MGARQGPLYKREPTAKGAKCLPHWAVTVAVTVSVSVTVSEESVVPSYPYRERVLVLVQAEQLLGSSRPRPRIRPRRCLRPCSWTVAVLQKYL